MRHVKMKKLQHFKPLIKRDIIYTKSLNFLLISIISFRFEQLYSDMT